MCQTIRAIRIIRTIIIVCEFCFFYPNDFISVLCSCRLLVLKFQLNNKKNLFLFFKSC